MRLLRWVVLAALLTLPPASARAVPLQFEFVAEVTGLSAMNSTALATIQALAPVGSTFTGYFRYDTDTPLNQVTSTNFYSYYALFPYHHVFIDLGNGLEFRGANAAPNQPQSFSISQSVTGVANRVGYDAFVFSSLVNSLQVGTFPADGTTSFTAQFELWDDDSTAFPTPALPTDFDLDDFEIRTLRIYSSFGTTWAIDTEIRALAVIPEPSTGLLVAAGLAACSLWRRTPGSGASPRNRRMTSA